MATSPVETKYKTSDLEDKGQYYKLMGHILYTEVKGCIEWFICVSSK